MRTKLEEMVALTEAVTCRTRSLLTCFGETLEGDCGHCDNCEAPPITADATTEAQMVLSAVYRTDQIFGAVHIVSVLRGERTEAVLRHKHDRLRTFGVGAAHAAQLLARADPPVDRACGRWTWIPTAMAACSWCRRRRGRSCAAKPGRVASGSAAPGPGGTAGAWATGAACERRGRWWTGGRHKRGEHLYEALRLWRLAEAKGQSIPPYVIFHDSVLREIAATRPVSLDELAQIKGVGASKLARYGSRVLGVLSASLPAGLAPRS